MALFGSPVFTELDDIPRLIAYGDFDGDGRKDAVVSFSTSAGDSARLVFLRGKADGSFEAARALPTLPNVRSFVAVDVNRNGQLDLVALGCPTSPCSDEGPMPFVFLGNGAGGFSAPVGFARGLGSTANAFAVADFNGDGIADIAVGRVEIAVLLGNGDGTFKAPIMWTAGSSFVISMSAGDFTGDGRQDLLVVYTSLTKLVTVLPGRGNGEFGPPLPLTALGSFATSLAVTDLNRDGKPDLLLNPPLPSRFQVRLGLGNGTFADGVFVPEDAPGESQWTVGDLNADGVPDILMRDSPGNVAALYGRGDGTFVPRQALPFTLPAAASSLDSPFPHMELVDLNGDGKLDLVTSNGSTLAVRLNTR